MPSNRVQINGSAEHEWDVPDSRIEEVIILLNDAGEKVEPGTLPDPPAQTTEEEKK